MLKVICIDDKIRPHSVCASDWFIKEGEVYTVCGTYISNIGRPSYRLDEDPMKLRGGYDADRFIPLSTIDETTFERNYNTQPC